MQRKTRTRQHPQQQQAAAKVALVPLYKWQRRELRRIVGVDRPLQKR